MMTAAGRDDQGARISMGQYIALMIVLVLSTADVFLPTIVTLYAGRDSWISLGFAICVGVLIVVVQGKLADRFRGLGLAEYLPALVGRPVAFTLLALYAAYTIHICAIILRELAELINTALLPLTPHLTVIALAVGFATYTVKCGIEVIARVNQILFPVGMVVLVGIGLLVIPEVDFAIYRPVLERGVSPVLIGAVPVVAWFSELYLVLVLAPEIDVPKGWSITRANVLVILVLGVLMLIGPLAIGVFGERETADMRFSALELVRTVRLADFAERADAVVLSVWAGGIFIKIVVFYYVACTLLGQITKATTAMSYVYPVGALLIASSMALFRDVADLKDFLTQTFPFYGGLFHFVLPFTILLIAVIRKKGSKNAL